MKKTILTIIFTMLSAIMLYSDEDCECNKSTWFWNDEIKEKKQFIRDFIDNPDSLIYPEFYAKYKSFRIRNGFIEDNKDFFTGIGAKNKNLLDFYSQYKSKDISISSGRKSFPPTIPDYVAEKYRKKYITAYSHTIRAEFSEVKYLKGDIITGDEKEDYVSYTPYIKFYWYCKDGVWLLSRISITISYNSYSPPPNSYFEDW